MALKFKFSLCFLNTPSWLFIRPDYFKLNVYDSNWYILATKKWIWLTNLKLSLHYISLFVSWTHLHGHSFVQIILDSLRMIQIILQPKSLKWIWLIFLPRVSMGMNQTKSSRNNQATKRSKNESKLKSTFAIHYLRSKHSYLHICCIW